MEKTVKPAPSKVFDISKPGKSMANATSRPVIVSNRPIMQDPMMSGDNTGTSVAVRTNIAEKVVLQPLAAEETKEGLKPLDTENDAAEKPVETGSKNTKAQKKSSAEPEDTTTEPDSTAEEKSASASEASRFSEPSDVSDTESEIMPEGTPPLDGTTNAPGAKESAELEAVARQLEEIEKLTESRDYFLPINSVEKRRSTIVTFLGLGLIVVLGLLLVNLLLDVGVFRINGVRPVTHFFSS